ncbi:MAG TPA: hypothetical protein PK867_31125, partial [Pirellulales bacterium]|nr:hypothetical protein [Pirellulales bacterium]
MAAWSATICAALAGPPDLVVFEGEAVVHGLAFAESLAGGESPVASLDPSTPRPDQRPWQIELPPGAQWNVLAEGRVELLAEDSQQPAQVACPLPAAERHEIVLQLEDPLPGTGIYLGDEQGAARCRLGMVATEAANQVCFALAKQGQPLRPAEGPLPLCPPRPWFKLAFASGKVKACFSCDGAHWSPLLGPDLPLEGAVATVGIYCLPGPGTRSIRVAQFATGEAAAPPASVPPDLFGRLSRQPFRQWAVVP